MLIRNRGEAAWRSPAPTGFEDERAIQTIIEQSPDLLPGATGGLMAVVSEMSVPETGYIDVVGVDADGAITLVECKLRANPEMRRHVVGQVFAYAAGLWGLSYEAFDHAFAARSGAPLARRVADVAPAEWDEETFRGTVGANLGDGRFRLVIAVDQITDELARIVRYLNEHTNPELQILALELGYVADAGVEILLPTWYGREGAAAKAPAGRGWDEARVFAALAVCCSPAGVAAARHLYDFARDRGARFNWGVATYATVTARLVVGGKPVNVFSLYEWPAGTGALAVNFEFLVGKVSPTTLAQFADRLRAIPGVAERLQGLEQAEFKKRPSFPLDSVLAQPRVVEQVEAALDALLVGEPSG